MVDLSINLNLLISLSSLQPRRIFHPFRHDAKILERVIDFFVQRNAVKGTNTSCKCIPMYPKSSCALHFIYLLFVIYRAPVNENREKITSVRRHAMPDTSFRSSWKQPVQKEVVLLNLLATLSYSS